MRWSLTVVKWCRRRFFQSIKETDPLCLATKTSGLKLNAMRLCHNRAKTGTSGSQREFAPLPGSMDDRRGIVGYGFTQ